MKKSDKCDRRENKIFILIVSSILTGTLILLYFLDDSSGWSFYKICSCIIINLWAFFIIPALRGSYLLNKDKSLVEWFKMGYEFGASGISLPLLFAPYYGVKYYFNL
ncbi:MAG: hypothetical protein LBQ40_00700 [Clostridiales bacterium]|nr:hypothetical protein [Clostridiales bacterium]